MVHAVHDNFKTKEIVTKSTQVFNSFPHQYHTMEHYLQKHSSTLTRTNLFKWPQQSPFTFRAPCRIHYHKRNVSPLNEFLVVIRCDVVLCWPTLRHTVPVQFFRFFPVGIWDKWGRPRTILWWFLAQVSSRRSLGKFLLASVECTHRKKMFDCNFQRWEFNERESWTFSSFPNLRITVGGPLMKQLLGIELLQNCSICLNLT